MMEEQRDSDVMEIDPVKVDFQTQPRSRPEVDVDGQMPDDKSESVDKPDKSKGSVGNKATGPNEAEQDDEDKVLRSALISSSEEEPVNEWDENAKKLFKGMFGEDDPAAYLKERTRRDAEYEELAKEAKSGRSLNESLSKLSPALQRMIQMETSGEDPISYMRSLPDVVISGKEAKDLSDKVLLDTYLPGKISKEEWEAKSGGDYDDLSIDEGTLDYKIKALRQLAEVEHEKQRTGLSEAVAKADKEREAFLENYRKSEADSLAQAQLHPVLKAFAKDDALVQSFRNKSLERDLLYLDDGVTPSPNKFVTLLKAKLFDKISKIQYEVGYERGRQEGMQEGTGNLRGPIGGRSTSGESQRKGSALDEYFRNIEGGTF